MNAATQSKPASLVARFPNNREGRAGLRLLRKFANRDGYRLRVLCSGPRSTHWSTHVADAEFFRVYFDWRGRSRATELATELARTHDKLRAAEQDARMAAGELVVARFDAARAISQRDAALEAGLHLAEKLKRAKAEVDAIPAWLRKLVARVRSVRARLSGDLGPAFFSRAVLNRPGENVLDAVAKISRQSSQTAPHVDRGGDTQ